MDIDLVPHRHSLLADTTEILREAIRAGKWKTYLPGERKLCQQMQIGRDTLRLAIKQLNREKLLGDAEPGRPRKIITDSVKRGTRRDTTGLIAFFTPHPYEHLPVTALLEINMLRENLTGSGFHLEIANSAKAFSLKKPDIALEQLVGEVRADAWILHQSTAPIQRWFFSRGIPCLLHGQPQEGIDLPFVDIDYLTVGRHAGGHLISHGHRLVVLLRPRTQLRGLDMAEEGLCEAFLKHTPEPLSRPHTITEPEPPFGAMDLVASLEQFRSGRSQRPTALIATRARQVLTVLSWLTRQRQSLPDHLSIIALDHSPFLDHLLPKITCYHTNIEKTAKMLHRKSLELAESGYIARAPEPLMPDFIAGASVARIGVS